MNQALIAQYLAQPAAMPIIAVKTEADSKVPFRRMGTKGISDEVIEKANAEYLKRVIFPADKYDELKRGRRAVAVVEPEENNRRAVAPARRAEGEDGARIAMMNQFNAMSNEDRKTVFWKIINNMNSNDAYNWGRTQVQDFIDAKQTQKFFATLNMLETEVFKFCIRQLMTQLTDAGFKYALFNREDVPEYGLEQTSMHTIQMITSSIIANGREVFTEALESNETFSLWTSDDHAIGTQDFIMNLPANIRDEVKLA